MPAVTFSKVDQEIGGSGQRRRLTYLIARLIYRMNTS
jgi:hypothetical protein